MFLRNVKKKHNQSAQIRLAEPADALSYENSEFVSELRKQNFFNSYGQNPTAIRITNRPQIPQTLFWQASADTQELFEIRNPIYVGSAISVLRFLLEVIWSKQSLLDQANK